MNPAYKPTPFIPSASDSIARRWRDATTLSAAARKSYYRQILIIGRWANAKHPEVASPEDGSFKADSFRSSQQSQGGNKCRRNGLTSKA